MAQFWPELVKIGLPRPILGPDLCPGDRQVAVVTGSRCGSSDFRPIPPLRSSGFNCTCSLSMNEQVYTLGPEGSVLARTRCSYAALRASLHAAVGSTKFARSADSTSRRPIRNNWLTLCPNRPFRPILALPRKRAPIWADSLVRSGRKSTIAGLNQPDLGAPRAPMTAIFRFS